MAKETTRRSKTVAQEDEELILPKRANNPKRAAERREAKKARGPKEKKVTIDPITGAVKANGKTLKPCGIRPKVPGEMVAKVVVNWAPGSRW
ncbi:MAG: hypothetical protein WCJ81_06860 [bacterium]